MRYNFEWDPEKARANKRKHKVSFELASTVFRELFITPTTSVMT